MSEQQTETGQPDEEQDRELRKHARQAMTTYGLARLGLFVLLTIVIQGLALLIGAPIPLVASALLALLVAFPLSMLIFPRMRLEANSAVAQWSQRRKERKQWIEEELSQR